jgi:Gp157 protein
MSNSLSLYHLSKQYQALFAELYNHETGEVNEEIEVKVNELLPAIETKCINVANWIRKLEAEKREVEFLEQEIQKRKAAYTEEINHWQEYLKKEMQFNKLTFINCPYFTLKVKTNPYSTDIVDEFQIPAKFMKVKEIKRIETKPDKEAIKEEVLRTGIQVPGAHVAQKTKLEISINKL